MQALKELVLDDQRSRQSPDRFHPRRPSDDTSQVPACKRPEAPVELLPGQEVAERWELPLTFAYGLDAVGSGAGVVRVEAVESKPDEFEFLDILPSGTADAVRAGRNVRIELPASAVIQRAAATGEGTPSMGQLFDTLIENATLRGWIEAQPADGWRLAILRPSSPYVTAPATEQVRLRVVTTQFERAAYANARADGTDVAIDLPADSDRTRAFTRGPGTTPPGIRLIDEPNGYVLAADLSPGSLKLPSGRLVVGEVLLFEAAPLDFQVAPGSYPIHATLARYRDYERDDVALATLVLSEQPTVRWAFAESIAVDGGSATYTSPEGVAVLSGEVAPDVDEWRSLSERIFDSRVAHDYLVTEFGLSPNVNLVEFASGNGDGGYPVYIGYDAAGKPTQVVIDFLLLHLDWPLEPG
jgi:hypothetical protein